MNTQFLFEVGTQELIAQKRWGRAYRRGAKRFELRFETRNWLEARLGTPCAFSWYEKGRSRMRFHYPEPHMTGSYGYFCSLGQFWTAFELDAKWAQGFYTEDGEDDTGLGGFKEFVKFYAAKKKGERKKCVWFEPQP